MLTAILGAAGGVVAAVIGAWAVLRARRPRGVRLEIVDVTVTPESESTCVLDLKLRNLGDQVAVLKRLELRIAQARRFYDPGYRSALLYSETYDVMLPEPESAAESMCTYSM